MRLKATLDQWQTLIAIDNAGSIHAAAANLNKSHTTLIYAMKKLESQLGIDLLRVESKRSVLTDNAKTLLRRATTIVEQSRELEGISDQLSQGLEGEINVSIDHLCCREWLYGPMQRFLDSNVSTSVKIYETSLSSTHTAVTEGKADIAIVPLPIENYLAEAFGIVTMIPIVSKNHALAQKEKLYSEDLLMETQIVLRDLGAQEALVEQNVGWLKSQRRITVDNFDHAWQAIKSGLGFCRMPDHKLNELDMSEVVQLPLFGGSSYQVPLHIVLPKGDRSGPAAKYLFQVLKEDADTRLDCRVRYRFS